MEKYAQARVNKKKKQTKKLLKTLTGGRNNSIPVSNMYIMQFHLSTFFKSQRSDR